MKSRTAPRYSRRRFLSRLLGGSVCLGASGTATAAYARYVEPFWPAIERVKLDLPNLGPDLAGCRVLQLSDIHVSSAVPFAYLQEQVQRCAALEPDLVVITGDFVTSGGSREADKLPALLTPLRPRLGIFAVLGNHDYAVYRPVSPPRGQYFARRIVAALEEVGITVLRNQPATVRNRDSTLQLIGLDDLWSGRCDPAGAFSQAHPALPTITLAHNPDTLPMLMPYHWAWLLCGHTHGGQVRIPFYGAPVLPVHDRRLDAGLCTVADRRIYVNRGLGYYKPVRFNCRPELTEFTLLSRK